MFRVGVVTGEAKLRIEAMTGAQRARIRDFSRPVEKEVVKCAARIVEPRKSFATAVSTETSSQPIQPIPFVLSREIRFVSTKRQAKTSGEWVKSFIAA